MDVSVSGTIDQKTYLKKFRGASAPLAPLDPPMDTLSLVLPHRTWLFNITYFYHCDLMPPQISAHATEWDPAKMLPIGPRTC